MIDEETWKERPVVSWPTLTAVLAIGGVSLWLLIPSDYQMAIYRAKSYQGDIAEGLFKRSLSRRGEDDPATLRQLADVLEFAGRSSEALELTKRLTEIRPKRREYWERLIRLLEWNGRTLEATRAREQMLRQGGSDWKREAVVDLANQYAWLQAPSDAIRIYEFLLAHGGLLNDEMRDYLRVSFSLADAEQSERAGLSLIKGGAKAVDVYRILHQGFAEVEDPRRSITYGALVLGASEEESKGACESSDYADRLSSEVLQRERELLRNLSWQYIDLSKADAARGVLDALSRAGVRDFDLHFAHIELHIKIGQTQAAVQSLLEMAETLTLDAEVWRRWAKAAAASGESELGVSVLKALNEGTDPRAAPQAWKKSRPSRSTWKFWDWLIPTVEADEKTPEKKLTPVERRKNLEVIAEIHEASGDIRAAIADLDTILEEASQGMITLTTKERSIVQEKIAERFLWLEEPDQALARLPADSDRRIRGRAIKEIALASLERWAEFRSSAARWKQEELAQLEPDLLRSLRAARTADPALAPPPPDTEAPQPVIVPGALQPEGIRVPRRAWIGVRLNRSDAVTALSPRFEWDAARLRSQLGWTFETQWTRDFGTDFNWTRVGAGLVWDWGPGEARAGLGLNRGAEWMPWDPNFVWAGAPGGSLFRTLVLKFEGARPLESTPLLIEQGISESRASVYAEGRLSPWVEFRTELAGRATHERSGLLRGKGIEWSVRLPLGQESWAIRPGAWAYLMRWGSSRASLSALLSDSATILGPLMVWDWGRDVGSKWKGELIVGLGNDFASNESWKSGFGELTVARKLGDGRSSLLGALGAYTSSVTGSLSSAQVFAQIAWEWRY